MGRVTDGRWCQHVPGPSDDIEGMPPLHLSVGEEYHNTVLIDFSLTVKAATLIFISGRGSAISSAKEGKSGFIYNLLKS